MSEQKKMDEHIDKSQKLRRCSSPSEVKNIDPNTSTNNNSDIGDCCTINLSLVNSPINDPPVINRPVYLLQLAQKCAICGCWVLSCDDTQQLNDLMSQYNGWTCHKRCLQ